jgi:GT2 family glycosyltransferase
MESVGHNADSPLESNRSVAAIVVITEPSPELQSTLRALRRQDTPVTMLVVDDASLHDPTELIAEASPDAFVSRLEQPSGWAAAANAGAALVQGAHWLLITHDDVAPAPDAVREMVDVAIAHDADLVVPKLVVWTDHDRLLSVGYSSDRSANALARVDVNELDQGQHDFVRSVQAVDGACILVKASVFHAVGGFAASMTAPASPSRRARSFGPSRSPLDRATRLVGRRGSVEEQNVKRAGLLTGPALGEDVDLCWRILRAGGRAFVAPSARVAHAQRRHRGTEAIDAADGDARTVTDPASEALRLLASRRNRVVTVLSTLRGFTLLRAISALIVQRITLSRSSLPLPAVRRLLSPTGFGAIRKQRQAVASVTDMAKAEPSRLESQLVTGDITIRKLLGREVAKDSAQALSIAGDAVSVGWRRGPIRLVSGLFVLAMMALALGSRSLLGGVPWRGQFAPIPGVRWLLRTYGNDGQVPYPSVPDGRGVPGLLVATIARLVGFGQSGLVGFMSTTWLIPLGIIGAARLGSAMARAGANKGAPDHATGVLSASLAAALYGATPVAVAGIRSGSWEALLLYGALPWILFAVLFHGGELHQEVDTRNRRLLLTSGIRVGLPLAITAALTPVAIPVVIAAVFLLWFGAVVAGGASQSTSDEGSGSGRSSKSGSVVVTLSALVVCAALFAGWLSRLVVTPILLRGRGATGEPTSIVDVLRLAARPHQDGDFGVGGWLTLGIPLAALITMLLVNELRLKWALRWWMVAVGFGSAMWLAERGPLIGLFPSHEVLAVPLALSMVLVVTIGISAVTQDIRRAQFGWRQTATLTAIAAVIVAVLPIAWSARSGTWGATRGTARTEAEWIADSATELDSFETLWIGSNDTVDGQSYPVVQGSQRTPLGEQARWNLTGVNPPYATALWGSPARGSDNNIGNILEQAGSGSTFRVGSLLPNVRYIVIAPPAVDSPQLTRLTTGLNQQLDLQETDRRGSVAILENTAYAPNRTTAVSKAGPAWVALRWLQLLLWSGATVAFLADWSARRRRLDQLAAEFDDLADETDHDFTHAWDASLTVEGAFRPDDDVYADVFDDTHSAKAHATKSHSDTSYAGTQSSEAPGQLEPESLADQLWVEWSQRHGRDQTITSAKPKKSP